MDGQTDPRWLIYKHSILGYQKSIQVIAAQRKCRRTDRQTVWRIDDVITLFFNVGALIIMHKKELMWLIRSNNWPMQIRLSTCGFIACPVTTRVPFWVLLRNFKEAQKLRPYGRLPLHILPLGVIKFS